MLGDLKAGTAKDRALEPSELLQSSQYVKITYFGVSCSFFYFKNIFL